MATLTSMAREVTWSQRCAARATLAEKRKSSRRRARRAATARIARAWLGSATIGCTDRDSTVRVIPYNRFVLLDVISRYWGYSSFRPLQEDSMNAALAGRDS